MICLFLDSLGVFLLNRTVFLLQNLISVRIRDGPVGDEWTLVAKEVIGIGLLSHMMERGERCVMNEDGDPRKGNGSFTVKAVELCCEE